MAIPLRFAQTHQAVALQCREEGPFAPVNQLQILRRSIPAIEQNRSSPQLLLVHGVDEHRKVEFSSEDKRQESLTSSLNDSELTDSQTPNRLRASDFGPGTWNPKPQAISFTSKENPHGGQRNPEGINGVPALPITACRLRTEALPRGKNVNAHFSRQQVKVRKIGGHHSSTVATGRQSNQSIVLELTSLVTVPSLRIANLADQSSCFPPIRCCGFPVSSCNLEEC